MWPGLEFLGLARMQPDLDLKCRIAARAWGLECWSCVAGMACSWRMQPNGARLRELD